MAEEKPVILKKERKKIASGDKICIIHSVKLKSPGTFTLISQSSWDKIQSVAGIRKQAANDTDKQSTICAGIPSEYSPVHGYHRACYQSFTNIKYILKRSTIFSQEEPTCSGVKRSKWSDN